MNWRSFGGIVAALAMAGQTCADRVIQPPESRFKFWDMPTVGSQPCDVAIGPDGVEWLEEVAGNNLVRLNPNGTATEYPIPFTVPAVDNATLPTVPGTLRPIISCGLDTAPNGKLYAINGFRNQIVEMNVTTKEILVHTAPNILGDVYPLSDLTPAPDGIYFTQSTGNAIGRMTYDTHEFTQWQLPNALSVPIGIYYASDGGVWFTEFAGNRVGRLDRKTHKIQEYDLSSKLSGPMVMRAETEGRYLWFAAFLGGSLGRIDMRTRKLTAYPVPGVTKGLAGLPVENCPDTKGNIWFSYNQKDRLGRFNPKTKQFLDVIQPGDLPPHGPISLDPIIGDGIYCKPGHKVWFSQMAFNRAGYYQL